jgi:hypothetical protein
LIPVALMLICGQAPQSPTRTIDVHRAVRFSLSRSDLFHIICFAACQPSKGWILSLIVQ